MRSWQEGRRLCALGLILGSAPLHAANVSIEVQAVDPVPEALWLAPEDALQDDGRWLELPRVRPTESSSFAGNFSADVAPGRYRLVAFRPAGVTKRTTHLPLRSPTADGDRIVVAGSALDLGRVEFLSRPLGLTLLYRGEPADVPGWAVPSAGERSQPVLQALRDTVSWTIPPTQSADGTWSTLVSGNRLAVRPDGGQWVVHRVLAGGRTMAYHLVDSTQAVVSGELGRLEWQVFGQPAQPLQTEGWPEGQVDFIRCDPAKRCAASIKSGDDYHLVYTPDAASTPWKALAQMPAGKCVWTCTQAPVLLAVGDEVIGLGGKHDLWRLRLADGQFGHETLPFRIGNASVGGGRLVIGTRYSTDAGRTWKEGELGRLDQALQFDDAGRTYAIGWDRKMSKVLPVLRQSAPGADGWTSVGVVPVAGGKLAVGKASPTVYLGSGERVWVSNDHGKSWGADVALYQALATTGAER